MAWRMAGRWRDARYRLGGEQMGPAVDGSAIELPLGLDRSCEAIVRPTLDAVPARDIVLALFDTHRAGALRYTRSLGLADGDGEDVVQDVFLALFLHVSRGGAQTNLVGWIFRVAHRLALRKRARDARAARFRRLDATRLAADVASSPEEEFAAGRRRARLVTAVSELPERDRRCLILRAEGVRYRDIAGQLGMSLGSVANAIARALARLRHVDEG
jgi:RNA polymerase sigma-70 factor (ECF subfamily)